MLQLHCQPSFWFSKPLCCLGHTHAKSVFFDLKSPGIGNASRGEARGHGAGGAQP